MAGAARNPSRLYGELCRDRKSHWLPKIGQGGRQCVRRKRPCCGNPVPPRGEKRWTLSGYHLGAERKRALLKKEKA
jgi:hypothetical protein